MGEGHAPSPHRRKRMIINRPRHQQIGFSARPRIGSNELRTGNFRKGATVSALVISSLLGASSLLAVGAATSGTAYAEGATVPHSYLVFFDFNKSNLTPAATKIVDQAAAEAAAGKAAQLTVTGHTDTVGSDAYNMRLSRSRAESVAAQLETDGIPTSE